MSRKSLFYFGISLWIILFLGVSPAASFEFSFRGAFFWDYVSYSQLGSRGFFGPYDVDNADPGRGGAASANGWLGYRITSLMSSSTDAANSTMMMDMDPRIKINEAITNSRQIPHRWVGVQRKPERRQIPGRPVSQTLGRCWKSDRRFLVQHNDHSWSWPILFSRLLEHAVGHCPDSLGNCCSR